MKKLSPIHNAALTLGASMIDESGWMMPRSYSRETDGLWGIGLIDQSNYGKIMIHGLAGGRSISNLSIEPPDHIGQGAIGGNVKIYRLRADQLIVITLPGDRKATLATLQLEWETGEEPVTITDMTHGCSQLRLLGPGSPELLARICSLDFASSTFPDTFARQTSVAKTTQLLIRDDLLDGALPSYLIIGPRSLGAYLWNTLLESGHDLGIRPIGTDDLSERTS